MRVDLLDPSAYTPPYDRALASALSAQGASVRLLTSEFPYGDVPAVDAKVAVDNRFYRGASGPAGSRRRALGKLLSHVPDMLAYRREADRGATDIAHFQWLSVQQLDGRLLPRRVPVVLTAHDVLPREPRPGQRAAQKRLYERVDQIVVHSEHGRSRLVSELGIDPARVTIIHHGAFTDLATLEPALPPGLERGKLPIAVLPGLMRPYKGLDLLLDAWRSFGDDPPGELWIVGKSKMPPPAAADLPSSVRLIDRFVSDAELAGVMRAADLVVLPYREIDQSGVLYAALGLGRPMLLTDVGGFPEVAATGAAELVAPNDAGALAEAINRLLGDEERRTVLGQMAASAAASTYSWDSAAGAHLRLYETLLANR